MGTPGAGFMRIEAIPSLLRRVLGDDSDDMRYATTVSVWVRWFLCAAAALQVFYRPPPLYLAFIPLLLLLMAPNGWLHYRLITKRPVTRSTILGMGVVDLAAITTAVAIDGGFESFIFLAYYPAVATFAVLGGSFVSALAISTIVAVVYISVSLFVGSGIDLEARDEKDLFWRVAVLYATTVALTLITRFERIGRRDAVERERTLQRERIELSQTIHDTTAQTAYMIGLGLDSAIAQANESSPDLGATLAETSALAKSAMWELRRPIDGGLVFEGRALGAVLRAQLATFTTITSVPAEIVQSGTEPPLTAEVRIRLFSIVHNALANAFRHAHATRVDVTLDFEAERVRLSVSDDGVGLPADYAERGRGFGSMKADAERMGGMLIVQSRRPEPGTTVTCEIPHE